jgi:hypothetical protein
VNQTRTSPQQPRVRVNVTTWPRDKQEPIPPRPRLRRIKRQLQDYRSDLLLSGLFFVLLIWLGFVALTLWH